VCRAELPKQHGLVLLESLILPLNVNDTDITWKGMKKSLHNTQKLPVTYWQAQEIRKRR